MAKGSNFPPKMQVFDMLCFSCEKRANDLLVHATHAKALLLLLLFSIAGAARVDFVTAVLGCL